MRRFTYLLGAAVLICTGFPAFGGSWVFQRSYYSHSPAQRIQVGPRSYGGPYYTRAQGDFVRFGMRQVYSTIQVPGATYDNVRVWEVWVQPGSQR